MSRYLTDEELEDRARAMRKRLGLEHQARIDMMTIINKLKSERPTFNYRRVSAEELPDGEAQWDFDRQTISMRESVFQGIQGQRNRDRMTVAHELGHFELGHQGVRNRSIVKTAAERYHSVIKQEESEATRFAPRLLAPAYLIKPEDSAETISQKFGISLQAAEIRRFEVSEMERRAAGKRRELPGVVVDFLREAKRRGAAIQTDLGE